MIIGRITRTNAVNPSRKAAKYFSFPFDAVNDGVFKVFSFLL